MDRCFCVKFDDELELVLDVDNGEYRLVPDCDQHCHHGTPLHWAAATGQAAAVSALLELNANPDPRDCEDGTPLHYAQHSGHMECVRILSERLGLSPSNNPGNRENLKQKQNNNQSKPKRSPIGFLTDLFRPKKTKSPVSIEVSPENDVTIQYSSHEENSNSNSEANRMSPCRSSTASNVQLSTPKRQKESDILQSMEKLQISRADNPLWQKQEHHLGEIRQSHAQNVPISALKKALPPPRSSPDHHNCLIRSPPPTLKRTGEVSPVPGMWTMGERNHAQLEEDAAQILALQRQPDMPVVASSSGDVGTPRSTPRSKNAPLMPLATQASSLPATPNMNSGGRAKNLDTDPPQIQSSPRLPPVQLAPLKTSPKCSIKGPWPLDKGTNLLAADGAIDNGASSSRENSTKKKKKKKKTKSTKSSSGAKIEVDAALADTKESVELTCNRLQPLAPVTSEKLGSSPVTPEKPGSSQVVVEADVNMTNTCTETQLSADASNNPVSVDQDDTIDRGISKDQDVTEDTSSSQQTSQTEESNVT